MKNKLIVPILVLLSLFLLTTSLTGCSDKNDIAQKNTKDRYLTIINATEQTINEIHVTVGEGTEIESMTRKNPDAESLSIKIPEAYNEYTEFTVTLIDRYDLKYQKTISNVPLKGRSEVKITKDDYVKEKGDLKDKIDKFFNGD